MGAKFPAAEQAMLRVWVCLECKSRNAKGAEYCRRCNYTHLRPKKARKKEGKAGK